MQAEPRVSDSSRVASWVPSSARAEARGSERVRYELIETVSSYLEARSVERYVAV